jgi:hypothetical protein
LIFLSDFTACSVETIIVLDRKLADHVLVADILDKSCQECKGSPTRLGEARERNS